MLETREQAIGSVTVARGDCPGTEGAAVAGRGRRGRGVGDAAVGDGNGCVGGSRWTVIVLRPCR